MLEKNEYPVDFKNKELKSEIKNLIGNKKSVVFQLVNSLSKVDPKTGIRTFKRRHLIEAAYTSYDVDGNTTEFRYYKNKRQNGRNGVHDMKYTPEFLTFENGGRISINLGSQQNENLDLFWALYNHGRRASNQNGEGSKRPLFYLVDENVEALEYAQKKEAASEMDKLLWNPTDRLPEDELFKIARALRIRGVDDMNIQRVQQSIDSICKGSPQRFLNLIKTSDETSMRANIQSAVEIGVLIFDKIKLEWLMSDGENKASLCTVRKTDDETSALVLWLKNNDDNDHHGRIKELISESKKAKIKA